MRVLTDKKQVLFMAFWGGRANECDNCKVHVSVSIFSDNWHLKVAATILEGYRKTVRFMQGPKDVLFRALDHRSFVLMLIRVLIFVFVSAVL